VEPLREVPDPEGLPAGAAAVLALRPLVDRFPDLARVVRRHSDLLVTFSPAARRSLALGDLHLMQAGRDLLPTAVSASGKIVETARVVPGTAVGTGVAIGATGLVAWPIVLAAAVGVAAAYAEQRWLTTTFTAFRKAIKRSSTDFVTTTPA
jgi:hypothetical protein